MREYSISQITTKYGGVIHWVGTSVIMMNFCKNVSR